MKASTSMTLKSRTPCRYALVVARLSRQLAGPLLEDREGLDCYDARAADRRC